MRLGLYPPAGWRPAFPTDPVELTQSEYDDAVAFWTGQGYDADATAALIAVPARAVEQEVAFDGEPLPPQDVDLYPGLGGGSNTAPTVVASPLVSRYRLRLDGHGELQYWLSGAQWSQALNEPDQLRFSYPVGAVHSSNLVRPKRIRLMNSFGRTVQRFWIRGSIAPRRRVGGKITIEVRAESHLGTLKDSWVPQYPSTVVRLTEPISADATEAKIAGFGDVPASGTLLIDSERVTFTHDLNGTLTLTARGVDGTEADDHGEDAVCLVGKTWKQHISDILKEFQVDKIVSPSRIKTDLGSELVFLEFKDMSIYDCLKRMHQMRGLQGQMTVTPTGRFVWVETLGRKRNVTLGTNLKALDIEPDDEESFATRLYLYGGGESIEDRVTLDAPGYVQRNTGTYGVVPKSMVLEDVWDPVTLASIADALIRLFAEPTVAYEIDAVEQSVGEFTVGGRLTITDSDLGVSTQETVFGITRPLDEIVVSMQAGRKRKDIARLIQQIQERLAAQETARSVPDVPLVFNGTIFTELPPKPKRTMIGRCGNQGTDDDGRLFKRGPGNNEWVEIGEAVVTAASVGALPSNVRDERLARVDGELYERDEAGENWVPVNRWVPWAGE